MDRIALISDVHGNVPALEAVLADIDRRSIHRVMNLGDLAGKGPDGAEVIDTCRERCEATVMGNWDAAVADTSWETPMMLWAREQAEPERVAWLASLPHVIDLPVGRRRLRLLHASAVGVYHRVFPWSPREELDGMFATTDFTGLGAAPDTVAWADIHIPCVLPLGDRLLLNVGSVGNPLDVPLACYVIVEGDAATGAFASTIARVPYDIERAVHDAEHSGMPETDPWVRELRTARYRGHTD